MTPGLTLVRGRLAEHAVHQVGYGGGWPGGWVPRGGRVGRGGYRVVGTPGWVGYGYSLAGQLLPLPGTLILARPAEVSTLAEVPWLEYPG